MNQTNQRYFIARQRGRLHACQEMIGEETGLVRGADCIETLCGKRLVQKAEVYARRLPIDLVTCEACQRATTGSTLGAMLL